MALALAACSSFGSDSDSNPGTPTTPGNDGGSSDASTDAAIDPPVEPTARDAGSDGSTVLQPPTLVQTSSVYVATPAHALFKNASVAGNLIVVAVTIDGPSPSSITKVTDNVGNDYESANAASNSGCGVVSEIWFAKHAKGGVLNVQVEVSATKAAAVWILEAGLGDPDATNTKSGGTANPTITGAPVAVATVPALVVSVVGACNGVNKLTSTDFELLPLDTHGIVAHGGAAYTFATTAGNYDPTWLASSASGFCMSTASFRP